jgi:dihydrofolate reductase
MPYGIRGGTRFPNIKKKERIIIMDKRTYGYLPDETPPVGKLLLYALQQDEGVSYYY